MGYFHLKKSDEHLWNERSKDKTLKGFNEFLEEEDGMGTVEVILIVVVLVSLVVIFKNHITQIIESLFEKITKQTNRF